MKTTMLACDGDHPHIVPAVETVTVRFHFGTATNKKVDLCADCMTDLLNAGPLFDNDKFNGNGTPAKEKKNSPTFRDQVLELLASDPNRAWTIPEVKQALPGRHGQTYAATLSQLHRENFPVKRVGEGLYTYTG